MSSLAQEQSQLSATANVRQGDLVGFCLTDATPRGRAQRTVRVVAAMLRSERVTQQFPRPFDPVESFRPPRQKAYNEFWTKKLDCQANKRAFCLCCGGPEKFPESNWQPYWHLFRQAYGTRNLWIIKSPLASAHQKFISTRSELFKRPMIRSIRCLIAGGFNYECIRSVPEICR
jgi:hypothetical protein